MDSLIGRIGFAVGKQYQSGALYFKASALHEFCGSSTVNMIDKLGETYTSENDYGDTWFELGLGGSVALSKTAIFMAMWNAALAPIFRKNGRSMPG